MDDELIRRAMRGDADAFERLGRPRYDALFRVAHRILRNVQDAEDAVQQAMWEAWRDLPGLRDVERFDAWLYRLLVRACQRLGRHEQPHRATLVLLPEHDRPDASGDRAIDDRDEMEQAFATLTPDHRAVVVLHHYLGLPLVEIAELLGSPEGTIRSRLHYAHRRLRDELSRASADRRMGGRR